MDIGEIICGAVDTIVSKRLEGLQYDITKICTIVDDSKRSEGEYVVNDGSGKFRAYSNETHYRNGNSVLVKIPSGDYTLRKTIEGLYNQQTYQPFNYEPPLNKMTSVSSLDLSDIENDEFSILANNGEVNVVEISPKEKGYDIANKEEPYTRLGVRANFKAPLNALGAVIGSYGLCLMLIKKDKSKALLYLDTSDMYGDPYAFEGYFSQEKVFDLTSIGSFDELHLYLYQKSDFCDDKGELIKEKEDGFPLPNNIFVKDIEVFLGYDENYIKREGLYLFTADPLEYDYNSLESKNNVTEITPAIDSLEQDYNNLESESNVTRITPTVNLKWYIYDDEGNRLNIFNQPKEELNFNYEVHWYRRHDVKDNLEIGWEEISDIKVPYIYTFTLGQDKQTEEIKVVGFIKGKEVPVQDEDQISGPVESKRYESNILTFTNKNLMPDSRAMAALKGLSLNFSDNSNGNYLIYNQNGKLLVDGADKQKRTVELYFNNASIVDNHDIKVTNVKWFFPKENERAMISSEVIPSNELDDPITYSMSVYGISFYGYKTNKYTRNYYIKDNFSQSKSQNYIIVQADVDGTPCEVIKELTFGRAGTSGNLETLVLDFVNNDVLDVSDGGIKTVTVKAQLYDAEGVPLALENAVLDWKLMYDDGLVILPKDELSKNLCNVHLNENKDLSNSNYTVLQCDLTYQEKSYSAKIPIPIKNGENYLYLEGAKEIIYDYNGVPSYYAGPYRLRYLNKDDKEIYTDESGTDGYSWELLIPDLGKEEQPPLSLGSYNRLVTNPFYIDGAFEQPICINCLYGNKKIVVWSQPIVAWQNKYDIQLLNEWSGTGLKFDEDNGTIISTMLGAGHKNEDDNTFSGVLIGDVKKGTEQDNVGQDNGEQLTGIYGISHGVQTYSLTEDGKATFGAKGHGQIIIDGKKGQIKSASWDKQSKGMLIDLDDGKINISVPERKKKKDDSWEDLVDYFWIKDPDNNELIHIDNDKYYLQSSDGNTRLDLQEGTFISRSENGRVKITSHVSTDLKDDNNFLEVDVIGQNNKYLPILEFGPKKSYLRTKNYLDQEQFTIGSWGAYENIKVYRYVKSESFGYQYEYPEITTYTWIEKDDDGNEETFTNKFFTKPTSISEVEEEKWKKASIVQGTYFGVCEKDDDYIIFKLNKTNNDTYEVIEPYSFASNYDGFYLYSYEKIKISKDKTAKRYHIVRDITQNELKDFLISNSIRVYTDNKRPQGIEIDLNKGIIQGYDLFLKGTSDLGSFILDSSALGYPIQVLNNSGQSTFSVSWDGTLNCNKVKSLNNDGRDKYAISIGNNFYVTSSGSAGGGTWGGSSLGVAGFHEDTVTSGKTILRK